MILESKGTQALQGWRGWSKERLTPQGQGTDTGFGDSSSCTMVLYLVQSGEQFQTLLRHLWRRHHDPLPLSTCWLKLIEGPVDFGERAFAGLAGGTTRI
jgi:hypothetical protein